MLRRVLIAASESQILQQLAADMPPARRVATRFVAGETLDDAMLVARQLRDRGCAVTLDYLGEDVDDGLVARQAASIYQDALARLAGTGLDASISVKPSQVGLHIAPELCHELTSELCASAAADGRHVTLDMEGSDATQQTVDLVRALRKEGHDNVGCAVQTYLHRTLDDVVELTGRGVSLRICKGAYAEPPEIASQDDAEVSATFVRAVDHVLGAGVDGRFATHDHRLIRQIRNLVRRHQVPADAYEFQMLHGVREPLQQELVSQGHRLRIYVPFGDQWYPYLTRRLAERPANLAFFLRALAGRRDDGSGR